MKNSFYCKKKTFFILFLSLLFNLTIALDSVYAYGNNATKITSIDVNYANNTINVHSIGKPFYKGYLLKRINKNYFIIAFRHAVLYGRGRKLTRTFNNVINISYSQFSAKPSLAVHLVIREKLLKALRLKTINLGYNKFDTIIYVSAVTVTYPTRRAKFNVFIDAGHGGDDPGGIGPEGLPESFVNLSIALRLKRLLNAKGIKTEIDRTSNINVSLSQRANEANRSGANLFIGLYCNSIVVPYLYGTTTYYFHKDSYAFAKYLNNYVSIHLNLKNDGTVMDDLYVIRFTTMPAVIIEYAYISNPFEEHLLASSTFRELLANAISNAIYKYFMIDKR